MGEKRRAAENFKLKIVDRREIKRVKAYELTNGGS
jgi:hypothetical protein